MNIGAGDKIDILLSDEKPQFILTIERISSAQVSGSIESVGGWSGAPDYVTPCDLELYLTFVIRWDGCSHITFGERDTATGQQDGYLHLCGEGCWEDHAALMGWLFKWASEVLEASK